MAVTVSLYLDERVKKKDSFFPLKIRVTHDRQRSYLSINSNRINKLFTGRLEDYRYVGRESYSIEKTTYEKITQLKPRGIYKELQIIFRSFELEYQQMADKLKPFTIERFKEQFNDNKKNQRNDVYIQLSNKIEFLKNENRFNSAMSYSSTSKALTDFNKKKKLSFDSVTPKYLTKFHSWMLKNNKSVTTAGIYLRSLRSLFNDAISQQVTANYPFYNNQNKTGFKIPAGSGRKIALSTEELKSIFSHVYESKYSGRFYVDSWKLLYLLQGINPTDLCALKYSNIQNNFIVFVRAKTKNYKSSEIKVPINDQIQNLFNIWGNPEKTKETFIWPVFIRDDKEEQIRRVRQFVKMINKFIKLLAEELKLDTKVTTYVARHTYATQLMRHGAPVAFISKQLGHANNNTTDNYLNSFEDDQLKDWQKKISEF